MKKPTYSEIASDYNLWIQYADPLGVDTEASFEAMSKAEKMEILIECFGR